jgi:hypothetical protein
MISSNWMFGILEDRKHCESIGQTTSQILMLWSMWLTQLIQRESHRQEKSYKRYWERKS